MVRVSIRVYVMILFCRSIALFSVFYAFHIYILNFAIPRYTHVISVQVPTGSGILVVTLYFALLPCYYYQFITENRLLVS